MEEIKTLPLTTTSTTDPEEMVSLDDRMKSYEHTFDMRVPPYQKIVVRLDGRAFSKFTDGFRKPFDNLFECAMINTMNDLVSEFSARTGYTHSDEITLIFPEVCTKEEFINGINKSTHLYDGRIMKLCSVLAGYCSTKFNFHITRLFNFPNNKVLYKENIVKKV